MALYAVIIAGGIGSRFWPRSRQNEPKQFLSVLSPESLIQNTFARLQPLIEPANVRVVTHSRYAHLTFDHLPAVRKEHVLAEPISRNTAPAVAFAAARLYSEDPDATMIVLPADHIIRNVRAFQDALKVAAEAAQEPGALVTIGIQPTHPATGYGYIQFDDASRTGEDLQAYPVRTFAEKPDLATAERFLDSGDFAWNSGMFIWRAETILDAMESYLPDVRAAFREVEEAGPGGANDDAVLRAFQRSPKISLDYGIMEPAAADGRVFVVPGTFGWNDVGDWRAVYDLAHQDQAGNAVEGNVILHNTGRSYVRSERRLVVLVGVRDIAVIDTDDAILVCNLDQTQQVKNIVDYLGSHGMDEYI
jgi:mannose-1-phosphate guanylyltransferase